MKRNRSGFTYNDLLVIVALVVLTVAWVVQTRANLTSNRDRVKCAHQLSALGKAIEQYANDTASSGSKYPRTIMDQTDPKVRFTYDTSDGGRSANPFAPGASVNDVCMTIFLLLRTQDLVSESFVCPDTGFDKDTYGTAPGANALNKVSFTKPENLSYSLANPFATQEAINTGFKWNDSLNAEFALLADMNPGSPELLTITPGSSLADFKKANSKNHGGDGQNVLYADGHVEWKNTPFCGKNGDNIYTVSKHPVYSQHSQNAASSAIVGPPKSEGDTVCLPVAVVFPRSFSGSSMFWVLIIGGAVLLCAGVVIAILVMRKSKAVTAMAMPNPGHYPPPPMRR